MMMNAIRMELENEKSLTENGAVGYATTGKKLLDANFNVASMRGYSDKEIEDVFSDVFYENRLLALKWLFFVRDVRGGLGERRLFRVCMKYIAENHTDISKAVLNLLPEYGRWDDLICLVKSPLEDDVINIIAKQVSCDIDNMKEKKDISLLAKWLPSINTSSKESRKLAKFIAGKLMLTDKQYRKMLSEMREYINVVERIISSGEWGDVDYSAVPSRANLLYKNAFLKHDEERRLAYLESLSKGETKINSSVLFPHDIVHKYFEGCAFLDKRPKKNDVALEEMWKALPDYVNGAGNTICVADGSFSMTVTIGGSSTQALEVANALAIYFSERCSGEFKDKYITFSDKPKFVDLSNGRSLQEKLEISRRHNECSNTNIEAVFTLILNAALHNNIEQKDMPKNILILSDMEFDSCAYGCNYKKADETLFDKIRNEYEEHGYKLPRLVFWNLNSRTGTIPVKENKLGVALVSGFSPTITKMVLSNELDPFKCLLEQINSTRYDAVETALNDVITQ